MHQVKHYAKGYLPSILRFKAHNFFCYECKRYSLINASLVSELIKELASRCNSKSFINIPKERVKVVCMVLGGSYRALFKKYFPKAKIAADCFVFI